MTAAEILTYGDSTAQRAETYPKHQAAGAPCDRDLIEQAIYGACDRGGGAPLGKVCREHATEVARVTEAERAAADPDGPTGDPGRQAGVERRGGLNDGPHERCAYCGADVDERDPVPDQHDAAAWSRLALHHASGCAWVSPRAPRGFS